MENQNENRDGLNEIQSQPEIEWSQKNESQNQEQDDDQSTTTRAELNNQQGETEKRPEQMQKGNQNDTNSQNPGSNPNDGTWSQNQNRDRAQQPNLDQQIGGADADDAASIPGSQTNASGQHDPNPKTERGEDPNNNANIENRNDQHGEGSLDTADRSED